MDTRNLQFSVMGPYRHSDGSFQLELVVLNPSPILGQPADVVATAKIHVKTDQVCLALAEALRHVAQQLPPELTLESRN